MDYRFSRETRACLTSKKLRVRIKRALERNVKDGKVMGGPFKPFGYQKGPENKLIIFEEESEIIKRIFDNS